MPKKLTTEKFRERLLIEHPELELLSEYDGDKNYVTVKCKKHNYIFNVKPNSLHHGSSCQKCYDERRGNTTRKSTEQIINEFREVHGSKYDYSKVSYKNRKTKVCIICPKHGEFWQTPEKHIFRGQGCPKCAGRNKTNEEVINEFKKIHKDDYIYNKVNYINNSTKICIICPIHGEFWQTPDKHLQGEGCPICKSSKLEKSVRNFLIENNIDFERQKKFDWLGLQSLDFYLPQYNIAIECQGEQHFKEFNGTIAPKRNINERIRMDITKNELCCENKVKLLYVMAIRWKKQSLMKKFNGLYTDENTILDKKLYKIKNILNS